MSPSLVPTFHRPRRRHLLALGTAALLIPAASASAATQTVKVSDPSGDQTGGGAGLDIRSAVISQNTSNGAITATVTFGAAPPAGSIFAVGLGQEAKDCDIEAPGTVAFLGAIGETSGALWALQGDPTPHPVVPTISGSTLKLASGSASNLKKLKWDCARVSIQQTGANENELFEDQAVAGGPSIGSQVLVQTDKPDGDKDGIPDVADACPTVPGSTANGCLAIAAKKAMRLGAKRLVVDKLVPAVGPAGSGCKATAKATVKDGRKSIGKGTLTVGVHGSYCHISGVIKIKKHGKKVKLSIKGSGFKAISANVKK